MASVLKVTEHLGREMKDKTKKSLFKTLRIPHPEKLEILA